MEDRYGGVRSRWCCRCSLCRYRFLTIIHQQQIEQRFKGVQGFVEATSPPVRRLDSHFDLRQLFLSTSPTSSFFYDHFLHNQKRKTWKQSVFAKLLPRQVDATGGHCPSSPVQSRLNANTLSIRSFFRRFCHRKKRKNCCPNAVVFCNSRLKYHGVAPKRANFRHESV